MREDTRNRTSTLFQRAVLWTAVFLGLDFVVTVLLTEPQRLIYSDLLSPFFGFAASAMLVIAARQSLTHSKRLAAAWCMIALSTIAFTLGDASWAILELGFQEPPFPSIADVFYLAYYPLMLAGVFLLPDQPATSGEHINKILDAGIVMFAAILGFWNYLIGPLVFSNAGSPFIEQAILLAYPVGDLVLLSTLLRIISKGSDRTNKDDAPTFFLAGSILAIILADTIYSYQVLLGTYASGAMIDIAWRASQLLAALAGVSQIHIIQSMKRAGSFPRRLESLIHRVKAALPYFPYLWLIAAYALLIQSQFTTMPMDFLPMALSVGGIICLVLLRQIITLLQNNQLNVQLQQTMNRLQTQAVELEHTNVELQNEIAERKVIEQQLTYDSLHDTMTGLPNRVLFLDRLGQAIEYCKRRSEYTFAVLFVDIDQFKVINDSLGHLTGDQLLVTIARRMKDCLRASDTVARFGGDEFAILLGITGEEDSASTVAEKLQEMIKQPLLLDGHELHTTASIGIVTNMVGYNFAEEVLRDADIAMYQAKASGKACFEIFDVRMRSRAFSRLEMEQELRAALENHEFRLFYQPIMSLKTGNLVSFEALIRWQHPVRGMLLPDEFLTVAEESGLILPLGGWVLRQACIQLKEWHKKYPHLGDVCVNVNVSNRQFSQPDFVEQVVETLQSTNLRPEALKLEITETVLINSFESANAVFTRLCELGIQLQIDDFGSGYSSLGYLQHFPISAVKIDKSFINEIGKGRRGVELIRAIVSMTRDLEMEAVAEGIETPEQLEELKSLFCSFGQGFLLSRPLDSEAAEKVLVQGKT